VSKGIGYEVREEEATMNGTNIKRAEKGLRDLRTARTEAKLSQEALAALIGTKRENISTWESGKQGITRKSAQKLSEHLDTSAGQILTANRLSEYQRAKKEGDAAGALLAIKGLIQGVGDEDLTPEGERFLDDLADEALAFAGMGPVSKSANPEEAYGYEAERDALGRNVGVTKAAASREASVWPSLGGGSVLPDPSEYDPVGHDGRNVHGHRIAPLPAVDEDDFEEEE
jgi:transcriptional regulator with XRE-family HTH domain